MRGSDIRRDRARRGSGAALDGESRPSEPRRTQALGIGATSGSYAI